MFGRNIWCLLTILLLLPAMLTGQTNPAPDFGLPVALPHALPPPTIGPTGIPHLPPVNPPGTNPPSTIGLKQLAQAAGSIFSGTVTAVARHSAARSQAIETVAVTFHVEQAIRGATPGEEFTITQWMGVWSNGQRYRVGDRLLLFLYPPSKLGLTSCVFGGLGRFNVDPSGRVLLSAQQLAAFRQDPVLGGKSRVRFSDFAWSVRRASTSDEEGE